MLPRYMLLTPGCLDTLGIGAVLAVVSRGEPVTRKLISRLSWFALPAGLLSVITLDTSGWHYAGYVHVVLYDTAMALIFCWLVAVASRGFSGMLGRFLTFAPITYCGRIAYGIYVYHLLLALPIYEIGVKLGLGWEDCKGFGYFFIASLITVTVAAVSWHVMEKPLNNLKRRFPYRHPDHSIRQNDLDKSSQFRGLGKQK